MDFMQKLKREQPQNLKNHGCRSAISLSITLGHGVNAIRLLPWHQRNPTCSILISVTPAMLPIASVDLVKKNTLGPTACGLQEGYSAISLFVVMVGGGTLNCPSFPWKQTR